MSGNSCFNDKATLTFNEANFSKNVCENNTWSRTNKSIP